MLAYLCSTLIVFFSRKSNRIKLFDLERTKSEIFKQTDNQNVAQICVYVSMLFFYEIEIE